MNNMMMATTPISGVDMDEQQRGVARSPDVIPTKAGMKDDNYNVSLEGMWK
jgi:hypothetical protein